MTPQEIVLSAESLSVTSRHACKNGKLGHARFDTFGNYKPDSNLALAAEHIKRVLAAGGTVEVNAWRKGRGTAPIPTAVVLDLYEPQFAEVRADERQSTTEINARKVREQLAELANRRLFAEDLDTTGDFLDPLAAANPLLAFRF